MNMAAVEDVGATEQEIADIIQAEQDELQRRVQAYRGDRPHVPVTGGWKLASYWGRHCSHVNVEQGEESCHR